MFNPHAVAKYIENINRSVNINARHVPQFQSNFKEFIQLHVFDMFAALLLGVQLNSFEGNRDPELVKFQKLSYKMLNIQHHLMLSEHLKFVPEKFSRSVQEYYNLHNAVLECALKFGGPMYDKCKAAIEKEQLTRETLDDKEQMLLNSVLAEMIKSGHFGREDCIVLFAGLFNAGIDTT
mmetsp:Transcript_29237/g.64327  ORF Transcript_29237/g.64327 Transcript_29237/m.64327 type:complete len:179 (+) Transcript_29237:392-928(+)